MILTSYWEEPNYNNKLTTSAHKTEELNRAKTLRFHPFVFTGKERDEETGYGYFGARYMDHELMTNWLSVDPMADKYPSISPYSYCAWNPVKLVDHDGCEATDNDDWYKDRNGHVHWDAKVHSQKDLKNGEEYLGKTVKMTAEGSDEVTYGDQYGHTWESVPLSEVSITETLTDFERTMHNPLVQSIHQSAADFWGHPVTEAVLDATLFVVPGGVSAGIGKSAIRKIGQHQAKNFFKGAKYTDKVFGQMTQDMLHGFPKSVEGFAADCGTYSIKMGGDYKLYRWLTVNGSYGNTPGTFEFIKDSKGMINHRFLNAK